ncbi:MAG: type II secretion system inner membrane protein GspF [bacterium]
MAVYEYKAMDKKGKTLNGIIDATTMQEARSKLRREHIFAYEIIEASTDSSTPVKASRTESIQYWIKGKFRQIRQKDIASFTRQLATLLKADMPLDHSLTAIIEQIENEFFKKTIIQIREKVKEGLSLGDALSEHPSTFSDFYIQMIKAGETSGALDIILERLAVYLEKKNQQQQKVWSALAYPILMISIGIIALIFIVIFVVPTITNIFSEMSQQLPLPTEIVFSISLFLKAYWFPLVIILLVSILVFRHYMHTESGRFLTDSISLKIPLIGGLVQKLAVTRFAQTLGTLINGGVPILEAMRIVKHIVNNQVMSNAIDNVCNSIKEGEGIASPLKRTGIFPPIVIHMISVGEKSGQIEEMLENIAESYELEVEATLNSVTSLLEPLIILFMGVVVAFIVMAILLPIFEMNQLVG